MSIVPTAPVAPTAISALDDQTSHLQHPASPRELFTVFTIVALQGFGGVVAVIQREMVERRRWFTREGFLHEWSMAQVMPGPNVVNFSIVLGDKYFGLRGAIAAMAGILLAPLLIMIVVAVLYREYAELPQLANALRGLGAATAGLFAATAFKMLKGLQQHPLGKIGCAAILTLVLVFIAILQFPLVYAVLGLGIPSCLLCAWVMRGDLPPTQGAPK